MSVEDADDELRPLVTTERGRADEASSTLGDVRDGRLEVALSQLPCCKDPLPDDG